MSDSPTKTKRRTRTPTERAQDLLVTFLSAGQLAKLDLPDAELLEAVRAAVAYAEPR